VFRKKDSHADSLRYQMKRCPECNRVETDEALKFCRVDGATLVSELSSINGEAGTVKLGSGSVSREIETSVLPDRMDANINRATVSAGKSLIFPSSRHCGLRLILLVADLLHPLNYLALDSISADSPVSASQPNT